MYRKFKFVTGPQNIYFRRLCSGKNAYSVEKLKDRSVLLVSGKDSLDLLQKLTTNDMTTLESETNAVFTLFLNDKGKIIHDALIYRFDDKFFIDVDKQAVQALTVHFKMHKGSREVDIRNVEDRYAVWSVYKEDEECDDLDGLELGGVWVKSMDPRLWRLGGRLVGPQGLDPLPALHAAGAVATYTRLPLYQRLRYSLGVAQGVMEIPYGRCHPCEANGDYLNALSAKKINFVGWENAAKISTFSRAFKRILPLQFPKNLEDQLHVGSPLEDLQGRKKTPIGYLCGLKGNSGIGLICVSEALRGAQVRAGKILAKCFKPPWWPTEGPSLRK